MSGIVTAKEDGRPWHSEEYEWKSANVNVAGTTATTDLSTQTGFTDLFSEVKRSHETIIETSGTAYFRLNTDNSDVITVTPTTPFTANNTVREIYVSTAGADVTVTVTMFR